MQKRLVYTEELAVAGGSPQDSAQDITSSLIAGKNPISYQKCYCPAVIGNDPGRNISLLVCPVFLPAYLFHRPYNGLEKIRVVVALDSLNHRCQALKPHTRINIRFRQGIEVAVFISIELREYMVPDLKMAIAFTEHAAFLPAAANLRSLVKNYFRAGTTWTGFTHHPEVTVHPHADNPFGRNAHFLIPDLKGLIVILVNGNPEFLLRKPHLVREKIPSPENGFLLEIAAKGKIPQHFKKGMMTGRMTDVFQVIVFSTGADALLGACRPRVTSIL